MLNLTASK